MAECLDAVGPVLEAGEVAAAIVAAIRRAHADAVVLDRGAYVRVLVGGRCRLVRADVEAVIGRPFRLPQDLECVMPAFKGTFAVSEDEAVWSAGASR